jgi:RNA polymerase sigma factor (sigma-70 family)
VSRSDQEWIRALKQNDAQAKQDLWDLMFTAASFRKYQTNAFVAEVAHDAAIVANERIIKRALYQFRFECPFQGYCLHIFANEFNRLIKIRKRDLNDRELSEELRDPTAEIVPQASLETIRQRLQSCLERLVRLERVVIESYYLENKDPEDAAAQLAITRNHYGVLAHRARQKLKRCLESLGFDSANAVLSL